jgi:hypothetical protein
MEETTTPLQAEAVRALTKIRLALGRDGARDIHADACEHGKAAAREAQARYLIQYAAALDEPVEFDDA